MRILVTGGNGYVGRTLCRQLMHEHEICLLDNLRYGSLRFTPEELVGIRLEQIDIRDYVAVATVMDDFAPEIIIHLAAIHFIPECEQNPSLAISTNVLGTVHLLSTCPKGCRFVFASSGAVYLPQHSPHMEDTSPLEPSDVYGHSKLQGETYVRYFSAKQGFPAVIVRLFNVVGPGETNPHVLPEIVAQLKAGRTTLQLGSLSPKRDYIDVNDAASGFAAAALNSIIEPGTVVTVNLGTQLAYSVDELLDSLRQVSGIDFQVITDHSRVRKIDRPVLIADRTRIQRLFNWVPTYSMHSTLQAMWKNPDLPASITQQYTE